MKNERETQADVRWLDETALYGAVVACDREAFAELMRRYDPIVRRQLARATSAEQIDEAVAEFWCGLISDDLAPLRRWQPGLGGLLAQWLMVLAAYECAVRLRQRAKRPA